MSNYYKKYLKYKLKYLQAKKSMSGGSLIEKLLEGDIERLHSSDDIIPVKLKNLHSDKEIELDVNKSTTIYELKIRLLRELNFDEYEGYIDLDSFIRIYYVGDEIDEGNLETNNIDGENLLTFEYFEDLLIVPVFYDISDHRNILSDESNYKERDNLRKSLVEKYIPNIKNGDIVYTGEASRPGDDFYIYIDDELNELMDMNDWWYDIFKELSDNNDFLEDFETDIELINYIYNDLIRNALPDGELNGHSIETLDYRPLFFNIINWSNSDKMKKRRNGYPNLYRQLNKNIGTIYEGEEDFLANMEEIKKYNKYSDIDLQCTVIEEPANQTESISLSEQKNKEDSFEISIIDALNDVTTTVNVNKKMTIQELKEQIFEKDSNAIKILFGSNDLDNNTTIEDNDIEENAKLSAIFIDNMKNIELRKLYGNHVVNNILVDPSDSIYHSVKDGLGYKNIPDNLLRLQIRNPENDSEFIEYSNEKSKDITFDDIESLTENITIYFKFDSPSTDSEYDMLENNISNWLSDDLNSEYLKQLASLTENKYDDDNELIQKITQLIINRQINNVLNNKPIYLIHKLAVEVFYNKVTKLDFQEVFKDYFNSDDY